MPDGKWAEFLMKLLDVSPYLVIMVVMALIMYFTNKASTNAHQKTFDKALEENKNLVTEAVREIRVAYETRK